MLFSFQAHQCKNQDKILNARQRISTKSATSLYLCTDVTSLLHKLIDPCCNSWTNNIFHAMPRIMGNGLDESCYRSQSASAVRFSTQFLSQHSTELTREVCSIGLCCNLWWFRDHSVYGFSQWETTLHYNVVSHCLNPHTEWSLRLNYRHRNTHTWMIQKLESILDVYVNVATVAVFLLFIFSWSLLLLFMKHIFRVNRIWQVPNVDSATEMLCRHLWESIIKWSATEKHICTASRPLVT